MVSEHANIPGVEVGEKRKKNDRLDDRWRQEGKKFKVTFGYIACAIWDPVSEKRGLWIPSRVLGEEHTHTRNQQLGRRWLCILRLKELAFETGPGSCARPSPSYS